MVPLTGDATPAPLDLTASPVDAVPGRSWNKNPTAPRFAVSFTVSIQRQVGCTTDRPGLMNRGPRSNSFLQARLRQSRRPSVGCLLFRGSAASGGETMPSARDVALVVEPRRLLRRKAPPG